MVRCAALAELQRASDAIATSLPYDKEQPAWSFSLTPPCRYCCCCCRQVAANTKGIQLVQELIAEHSLEVVQAYMRFIQANAGAGKHGMCCRARIVYLTSHALIQANAGAGRQALCCCARVVYLTPHALYTGKRRCGERCARMLYYKPLWCTPS
jgi:hypothetical protein